MKPANSVFTGLGTTVFEVMSKLAVDHEAVNLGQGFPDSEGPDDVRRKAADAVLEGPNQYPRMPGIDALRQAVAAHEKRFYGLDVDWQTEVLITSGATEALADCLFGLIEPGDEVVLIEPLYDSYLPIVERAGATAKFVRLTPPGWALTREMLDEAFSEKTKLIVLNNPMNPSAKVFSKEELAMIAQFLERFDAYAVCDEVYEHLVFDERPHIPLITLPGMRERCLKIGSAGKTFSLTGWKIGYITGAPALLQPVVKTHQFITFTTPPNLQAAVAYGLGKDDNYFNGLAVDMQARRDRLGEGLEKLGFAVAECAGTYFIICDIAGTGLGNDDVEACRKLTVEAGVAAIPVSAFYASEAPKNFIRFCFCKSEATIDEGLKRLDTYMKKLKADAA